MKKKKEQENLLNIYNEIEVFCLTKEAYYKGRNDELDERQTHKKVWPDESFLQWFIEHKK